MSHKSLTKRGYVLKKKHLTQKDERKLIRDLSFQPLVMPAFQQLARPKKFYTFLESNLRYYLPRYYGIEQFGPPEENVLEKIGQKVDFKIYWDLLPHQHKSWEAMKKQFGELNSGGILCLPCGAGKSSLAIRLASWLGVKTIIIVHKEFLLKQWKTVIEECTNARVGIIQRSKVDIEDKDIIIAMLHSLVMRKEPYPEATFKDIGCVIYDEVHHLGSEVFSKSLPMVASKYTLGLSATPRRKDGLTQVFLNYLGPIFHQEKRQGTNKVWVKFIEVQSATEHFDLEMMEHTGTKDTGKMVTNISKFEALNHLVLEICRLLVKTKPRKVLVLGARREQLEWLNEAWNELSYKNSKNKYATGGLYYGNLRMNKKLYWQMLEDSAKCDIIWGTNDIAKEGLDIKDLNTLVLLNGGQDVEQAVGRILRKFHDEVPPTVIDLIYKCGNFPKHANVRRDFYYGEDYVMHKMAVTVEEDEDSVYTQSDKLEKFLERYPEPGAPGTIKPKKRLKKPEIPLANRPPELKPITISDPNAPKRPLNLMRKAKSKPPPIRAEIAPARQDSNNNNDNQEVNLNSGWGGYDSDGEGEGIYNPNRGLQTGRLYLNDSDDEEAIPSLKELVADNVVKQREKEIEEQKEEILQQIKEDEIEEKTEIIPRARLNSKKTKEKTSIKLLLDNTYTNYKAPTIKAGDSKRKKSVSISTGKRKFTKKPSIRCDF